MKNFLSVSVIILCSLLLSGCNKKNNTPDAPSGEIKVGSKWVYKVTDFNEAGAVVGTQNVTLTITGEQTISGQKWFVLSDGTNTELLRKATDGWHQFKNNADQLRYKMPAALNDSWRVTYSAAAGDYDDITIKAMNQNVTVPAGTLSCYYTESFDSNSLEGKGWYNEQYVMVKNEEYDQNAAGALYKDYHVELVSFTP